MIGTVLAINTAGAVAFIAVATVVANVRHRLRGSGS